MNTQEIRDLLIDVSSNINNHIKYCNEALELLIKVLDVLDNESTENKKTIETLKPGSTEQGASYFLLANGLLNENQLKHDKNQAFINLCNEFINANGSERFNKVLNQVKTRHNIKNIYAYITTALENEIKEVSKC